jgi:hypothetical protein
MPARPLSNLATTVVAGLTIALASCAAAQAQPAPPPSQDIQQAVREDVLSLARLAAGFDCPKPAWTGVRNGVLTIEYVPEDEDVRSWKNLVTVTITPVPKGVPRAAASNRYIETILGALRQPGRTIEQLVEKRYSGDDARAAWVLYTIGEGAKREHNAAAIMLFGPGELKFPGGQWSVVMIQRQQRGGPLDDAWITLSKSIFMAPFEKKR